MIGNKPDRHDLNYAITRRFMAPGRKTYAMAWSCCCGIRFMEDRVTVLCVQKLTFSKRVNNQYIASFIVINAANNQ